MSFLSWVADRLILCPSTQPIDPQGKERLWVATPDGQVEIWASSYPEDSTESAQMVILKFPGTAGRAERAGVHPAEIWGQPSVVWTVNPKGYGGSPGPASIKYFPAMAVSIFERIVAAYPNVPVVVVGNSLGCLCALRLASEKPVAAVLLRNPPPIQQMIRTRPRYSSWNFGLSRWIANEVPVELDSVANSARSNAPCLFVQSEKDSVVPVKYQQMIIDVYNGAKRVFVIQGGEHHELVGESQTQEYVESLDWLYSQFKG